MDKYGVAFIESADKYLSDLKINGKNSLATLKDLTMYMILYDLYQSADWNEWSELTKIALQQRMNKLLITNPDLVKLKITADLHPKNVNTEQSVYTWRSIFITNTDLKTT